MYDDIWLQIIEIHQKSKRLFLIAEEQKLKTFIQPLKEQRDTLDHIIRAQAGILKINEQNEDYIRKNLDKALGHAYRTFFDLADWICMIIREKIHITLTPYSNNCIASVIPEYYSDIRPKIESLTMEIAEIRNKKDIAINEINSQDDSLLQQVTHYEDIIDHLLSISENISSKIPALEEFTKKENSDKLMKKIWDILLVIATAILTAIITYFVSSK